MELLVGLASMIVGIVVGTAGGAAFTRWYRKGQGLYKPAKEEKLAA